MDNSKIKRIAWVLGCDIDVVYGAVIDVKKQRDELLEALRRAKKGIEEFPDIGTAYEKLDYKDRLLVRIDAAIAKATPKEAENGTLD